MKTVSKFQKAILALLTLVFTIGLIFGVNSLSREGVYAEDSVVEDKDTSFFMVEGASIRTDNPIGIRFTTAVSEESYNEGASYFTLIYPTVKLNGKTIEEALKDESVSKDDLVEIQLINKAYNKLPYMVEGYVYFHAVLIGQETETDLGEKVLTDLPEQIWDKQLTAQSYYTTDGGVTKTWTECTENNSRSIAYIAAAELAEGFNTKLYSDILDYVLGETELVLDGDKTVFEGETAEFSLIGAPTDVGGTAYPVKWTSSNESVATVDENGTVTAVSAGSATITASIGNKTATATVYVDGVIAPFSKNANGLTRSDNTSAGGADLEYTTAYNHTGDSGNGSLRVLRNSSTGLKIMLESPVVKDISTCKYVVFYVYNPTLSNVTVGLNNYGATVCAPGVWTEVIVDLDAAFEAGEVLDLTGTALSSKSDITGLTLLVSEGSLSNGESIYISDVYAKHHATEIVDRIAGTTVFLGTPADLTLKYDGVVVDNEAATWESDNSEIATVSDGTVTGVTEGTAYITATYQGLSSTIKVTIKNGLSFEQSEYYIISSVEGKKLKVYDQGNEVTTGLTLSTEQTNVVTVNENGEITAVGEGVATITATYNGAKATCTVHVTDTIFTPDENSVSTVGVYWPGANGVSYDTTVKFDDEEGLLKNEKGSLKYTWNQTQNWNYIQFNKFIVSDISSSKYIGFYAFNGSSVMETAVSFANGLNSYTLAPGEWTLVKLSTQFITDGKAKNVSGDIDATDINGLQIKIFGYGLAAGDSIYFSSFFVGNDESSLVQDTSMVSTIANSLDNLTNQGTIAALSLGTHDYFGSTINVLNLKRSKTGTIQIAMAGLPTVDLTDYGYLVFSVYNPTNLDVKVRIYGLDSDTICAPGVWTEVIVNLDEAYSDGNKISKLDGTKLARSAMNGIVLQVASDSMVLGETIYVSNFYAKNHLLTLDDQPVGGNIYIGGGNKTLGIKYNGEAISDDDLGNVTLSSSDNDVAEIVDGKVKANKEGAVIITANYNGETARIYLTVLNAFTLDKTSLDLFKNYGQAQQIRVYNKGGLYDGSITWTSSDATIATVSGGLVTPQAKGTATITASIDGTSVSVTAAVTVWEDYQIVNCANNPSFARQTYNWCGDATIGYDSTTHYGSETKSLKVTGKGKGEIGIKVTRTATTDTSYSYLVFRVYNAASTNISCGVWWAGDTACLPGQWTEIRIPTSTSYDGRNTANIWLRVISALPSGSSVYFSNVYLIR